MNIVCGNIWNYLESHCIIISTNEGWNSKGENVMGAGLAKQAAERYPDLPILYGKFLRENPGARTIFPYISEWKKPHRLIMYPTKALNPQSPQLSWQSKSSIELIEAVAPILVDFANYYDRPIALPLLGTLNGGLNPSDMMDRMIKLFPSDKFLLVLDEKRADLLDPPF